MTNDNYSQITWPEVRKGDVLRHENGDRMAVEIAHTSDGSVFTSGVWRSVVHLSQVGFTPYRRKPEMPGEPGAYADKDGDLCVLGNEGLRSGSAHWMHFGRAVDNYVWLTDRVASDRAPFTRLVPMPTREQVREALELTQHDSNLDSDVAAVMALLTGNKQEAEQ